MVFIGLSDMCLKLDRRLRLRLQLIEQLSAPLHVTTSAQAEGRMAAM